MNIINRRHFVTFYNPAKEFSVRLIVQNLRWSCHLDSVVFSNTRTVNSSYLVHIFRIHLSLKTALNKSFRLFPNLLSSSCPSLQIMSSLRQWLVELLIRICSVPWKAVITGSNWFWRSNFSNTTGNLLMLSLSFCLACFRISSIFSTIKKTSSFPRTYGNTCYYVNVNK